MSGAAPDESTPREFMLQAVGGLLLLRALGVVAELRIADLVADGPRTTGHLARVTGAHEASLYRVLRMLAGHGVFAEDGQGRILSTARAEILRSDHPDSLRESFCLAWQDLQWATAAELPGAVMHGEVAFERAFGSGFFDYLAAHPAAGAVFHRRMAAVSREENPSIAEGYPFGEFKCVADIGGGRGGLLAAILERNPAVKAILFEQARVLEDPSDLAAAGLLGRVELIAGDFFDAVPPGADLYVMKRVLHDWEDARATQILGNCRTAMRPGARIAVIDAVMKPGNDPDPNKNLDLMIMALTPGKERTAAEFESLFAAAGLRMTRIMTPAPPALLSIVEGEPA